MSDYNLYPKVKPTGELPPRVLDRLDERYVNHAEFTRDTLTRVSVTDHGAVAGSTTSQSAAIQSAVDAAAGSGIPVTIPNGTFTMGAPIVIPSGTSLQMSEDTVLDFSSTGSSFFLDVRGSAATPRPFPGVVIKGSKSIALAGHSMVAGDWLMLRSADVYDPDSTKICHGELLQVRLVEAGVVHFLTPVCDDYRTTVTVTPVTMCTGVEISGGTILGNYVAGASRGGLRAQYTDGLRVTGTRFEGIASYHVSIRDSVDAWLAWCEFEWAVATATGYGASFADTTRDSGCVFSTFRGVRHSLSTNNTSGAGLGGVVRRILFQNNTVEYTTYALGGSQGPGDAIDTHTAAEDIWITWNTVNGAQGQGINMECPTGVIAHNTVINGDSTGISYHNESRRPARVRVTANTVRDCGSSGIIVRTGMRGTEVPSESLIITDNHVENVANTGIQAGVFLTDRGAVVTGNTVIRAGGVPLRLVRLDGVVEHGNVIIGGASMGVEYSTVTHGVLGPDSVNANAPTGAWTGLTLTNVTRSKVTPGAIEATSPGGVGVNIGSSCMNLALGPTNHLNALTPLVNNAGATVVQY